MTLISTPTSRIEQLTPGRHYTPAELRQLWRVSEHTSSSEIHRALATNQLFVTQLDPFRLSRTRPAERPRLQGDWQTLETLIRQQGERPLTYQEILTLWPGTSTTARRLLSHLRHMGYIVRPKRGIYLSADASQASVPLPATHLAAQRAQTLQLGRLSRVSWPARLWTITEAWQVSSNAASAYLCELVAAGVLHCYEGVYYLPEQPRPDPSRYPFKPSAANKRFTPKPPRIPPKRPNLFVERLDQVTWPTTLNDASLAWNLSSQTTAQVLTRLVKRGLLVRIGRGKYDRVKGLSDFQSQKVPERP